MKFIDTYITADSLKGVNLNGTIAVVIDIFRASTTITTLLKNRIQYIIPVLAVENAYTYRKQDKNILLMGERKGIKPKGFDYGNSPYNLSKINFEGSVAVLTTTNGTKALYNAMSADSIFIASLRNIKSLARVISEKDKSVVIVCSGTNSNFSIEDFYAAGILVKYLFKYSGKNSFSLTDIAYLSFFIAKTDMNTVINERTCRHYKFLKELGYIKDIEYSLKLGVSNIIPYFDKENKRIILYSL